ncbi:MAG: hypothetical protein ABI658_18250 [Acidimicrobiales bacterium]
MNLSERLAKAAMDRRRQPEPSAPRFIVTSIDSEPRAAALPEPAQEPVDPGRVSVMKMRLPEPASPDAAATPSTGLPLWQRPFEEVMRYGALATVTSLPIQPRDGDTVDEDLDDAVLAEAIPMPGVWMPTATADLPPLASSQAHDLASGSLSSEQPGHSRSPHNHLSDQIAMINLDDVAIDAEIVLDGPSADDLYQRLFDATQQQSPRVTFGPIDLRDQIATRAEGAATTLPHTEEAAPLFRFESSAKVVLPRADDVHNCPQCGATARVDIHDPLRGRVHLSCADCFKMWQERVETTADSDEPFMRD